jgi:hypothetical protein
MTRNFCNFRKLGNLTGVYCELVFNTINPMEGVAKNLVVLRIFQLKDLSHALLE